MLAMVKYEYNNKHYSENLYKILWEFKHLLSFVGVYTFVFTIQERVRYNNHEGYALMTNL